MHLSASVEAADTAVALPGRKPASAVTRLTNLAVAIAAAFPLLLAIALFYVLVLTSAARAQTPSCGGVNLVEVWRKTDRATLDRVQREADEIPNGNGLFWRIEKPGVAPSYLLGTMHVTDPRVLAMPTGAPYALAMADTVIVESDEIIDEKKASAVLLVHPDLTMFTDGRSIDDFLDPAARKALGDGLEARGIPLPLVAKMKPWLIASYVSLPACEISRKAAGFSFLDKKIAENAVRHRKKLVGLETLLEQLQAMDGLPAEFHVQALVETLSLGSTMEDVMRTTTDLYLEGRIGMIMPMMKAVAERYGIKDQPGSSAFEARIITQRNHTMATRAAPVLAAGSAFMAVGALHLPGKDGLIELFRNQGYSVSLFR